MEDIMEEYKYLCPICKQFGFQSIYLFDGCTACANTIRFGSPNPDHIAVKKSNEEKHKLRVNDWQYADYRRKLAKEQAEF